MLKAITLDRGFARFVVFMFFLLGLLALLFAHPAHAQTTAVASNTFDISPWLQLVIGVATAAIPTILGILAIWAKAHFKLAAGSNAANILDLLVNSGSQSVISALAKAPSTVKPIDVQNATVANILNTLSDSTLAAMKLKNVTPATIAARIDGAVQIALIPPAASVPTPAK
jgi:hypothetical protein